MTNKIASSFRDPSGFVFKHQGKVVRQVNQTYRKNYELLMGSGLYEKLTKKDYLICHKELSSIPLDKEAYKIIEPEQIPFVSYPYEWCFSALKDAALLTLRIQKCSLEHGMSLKDATSFNVQFLKGRPIFIDSLSFEKYEEGKPWVAYKQFCEQFLAPLALQSYVDIRLNNILSSNMAGVPLDLAVKMLPISARLNYGLLLHIFLHSRSQKKFSDHKTVTKNTQAFGKRATLGLVWNLEETIKGLKFRNHKTVWTDYAAPDYLESYSEKSLLEKEGNVKNFVDQVSPKEVWDLGANTGRFSRIAAKSGAFTISMDSDCSVVEQNYLKIKTDGEKNLLPLVVDLTNPSPAIGWHNKERDSLMSRARPDLVLALALVHHLAIGNNLPFSELAEFFKEISPNLVIEFVPKDDPQTQRLLRNREDVFPNYDQPLFEKEFGIWFKIAKKVQLPNSKRTLYLMKRKATDEKPQN